jgi:hypothetical protein
MYGENQDDEHKRLLGHRQSESTDAASSLTARAFDVRKLIKQGELAIGKPFNLKVRWPAAPVTRMGFATFFPPMRSPYIESQICCMRVSIRRITFFKALTFDNPFRKRRLLSVTPATDGSLINDSRQTHSGLTAQRESWQAATTANRFQGGLEIDETLAPLRCRSKLQCIATHCLEAVLRLYRNPFGGLSDRRTQWEPKNNCIITAAKRRTFLGPCS